MSTPNLGLTELANQQSQYLNANATFAIIDALLQTPVISKTLTAAPGSPADGALYIMASAWAGVTGAAAGRLALYRTGGGWIVITPKEGWKKEVLADEITYRYDGADWIEWSASLAVSAENVSLADVGGYYASDNAEGALQELGAMIGDIDAALDAINGEVI